MAHQQDHVVEASGICGLGMLPWLAVIFGVSWARVLRTAPADLAASRKEKAGMAFLWIALVIACLLCIPAADMVGAAVCAGCLAALLLCKALLRLSPPEPSCSTS